MERETRQAIEKRFGSENARAIIAGINGYAQMPRMSAQAQSDLDVILRAEITADDYEDYEAMDREAYGTSEYGPMIPPTQEEPKTMTEEEEEFYGKYYAGNPQK